MQPSDPTNSEAISFNRRFEQPQIPGENYGLGRDDQPNNSSYKSVSIRVGYLPTSKGLRAKPRTRYTTEGREVYVGHTNPHEK